jgi:hypothetical protein
MEVDRHEDEADGAGDSSNDGEGDSSTDIIDFVQTNYKVRQVSVYWEYVISHAQVSKDRDISSLARPGQIQIIELIWLHCYIPRI